jgi:hypothetical protein
VLSTSKYNHLRLKDIFKNLLTTGYWTDNGAYYYYHTLNANTTYEDTLIGLNKEFASVGLPFKYVEVLCMNEYFT